MHPVASVTGGGASCEGASHRQGCCISCPALLFLFVYTGRQDVRSKSSVVFIQGLAMDDDGLSYF